MICQNCGHEFINGTVCPMCKSDTVLLNKARIASLRQYNKGVFAAGEADYSGAIDALNQCILFDKRNHVARNLLGIAYFEIGMTSDALKQWIISSSMRTEKNPAVKYIDSLQKNARTLEKYNDAIAMYNKALYQFKTNGSDLAIIQLKKAVDFNPKFVEAYNLLALYYISIGDHQKAKQYIDKALNVDKKNPKALEYLSCITHNNSSADKSNAFKTGYNENAYIVDKFKKFARTELLAFLIGVILTGGISWTLIMPTIRDGLAKQVDSLEEQVAKLEDENTNGTSKFALKYKNLEEEYAVIKEKNEEYKKADENRTQIDNLQLANIYVESGKLTEAAELLLGLNVETFNDVDKKKIENLKTKAYPEAAKTYFEKGKSAFEGGDRDKAKIALETSLGYGSKELFIDNALYILGQISEEKGDIGQAKEYYGRVLNEFSDSDVFTQSEKKLNALLSLG